MTSGPDDDRLPTDEEHEAARLVVAAHADNGTWKRPPTLDDLLECWADLTSEVEEGYASSPPDLDNDVWCREALARVWPFLPDRIRVAKQPELGELDLRYRAATIPWPGHDDQPDWWEWRIPRRLASWPTERGQSGWPGAWKMMPFPMPDDIEIVD